MEGLAAEVEDEVKGVEYTTGPEEFLNNLGFKLELYDPLERCIPKGADESLAIARDEMITCMEGRGGGWLEAVESRILKISLTRDLE